MAQSKVLDELLTYLQLNSPGIQTLNFGGESVNLAFYLNRCSCAKTFAEYTETHSDLRDYYLGNLLECNPRQAPNPITQTLPQGMALLECDAPFQIGDLVMYDVPWPDSSLATNTGVSKNFGYHNLNYCAWGLTESSTHKAVCIVPVPHKPELATLNAENEQAWDKFIRAFYDRGQVIGWCVGGNSTGKGTIDVLMSTKIEYQ